jgi:hypothetical protein
MIQGAMFDITQDGDRWECRPTGFWAHLGAIFLVFGSGICLALAAMFFSLFPDLLGLAIGAIPFVGAIAVGYQAWRFWRLGRVPLTVESGGRVSYDGTVLCRPGSVRTVQIVPDPRPEMCDFQVVLETNDGRKVELEGPYFGTVATRDAARVLAGELAKALKVDVVET